jgi:SAM-dependent methyltransferase
MAIAAMVNATSPRSADMPIHFLRTPSPGEARTPEELYEQYVVERELAAALRQASAADRRTLYSSAYDELFRRVPHHPQLRRKISAGERAGQIAKQIRLLSRWLTPQTVFLEIGAGDCALSFAVAKRAAYVYAVDVSSTITQATDAPANFTLLLSDGSSIPAPAGSVTLAFSNQLMEHLHPDDALEQLANIYTALAPGGVYVCVTPNRLSGPHDISRYFDRVATGFHLKEYTMEELAPMFRRAGFRTVHQCAPTKDGVLLLPDALSLSIERTMAALPNSLRDRALRVRRLRKLVDIRLVACK